MKADRYRSGGHSESLCSWHPACPVEDPLHTRLPL